ncbi:MAG: hypothetical protein H6510_00495 [Acidobacteria bacterium]|nr:hypothetical protein [Acidobacteriota bacterium]MCB9396267.1 hypothetical protein [Acidobacteriota bacterium]
MAQTAAVPVPPLAQTEWQRFHPSLDRVKRVLALLGHPEQHFQAILVGGTNGKGTITANVAQAWGAGTGSFTSPHLLDVRERIRIDGRWVEDPAWIAAYQTLSQVLKNDEASYFEWLFLLAVVMFDQIGIKKAVFEVGLGGRWDATNALEPYLSVITSVELDHCEYLGPTREKIALEKIEIARPDRIFVAPAYLAEWSEVTTRLKQIGCHWVPVQLPEPTEYEHNLLTLQAVCRTLGWPEPHTLQPILGRRTHLAPHIYLDGAHNPMGWHSLANWVRNQGLAPIRILAGLSQPRDPQIFLQTMRPVAQSISIWDCPFEKALPANAWPEGTNYVTESEWRTWLEQPLLVCGSLYVLGAFLQKLNYQPSGW